MITMEDLLKNKEGLLRLAKFLNIEFKGNYFNLARSIIRFNKKNVNWKPEKITEELDNL